MTTNIYKNSQRPVVDIQSHNCFLGGSVNGLINITGSTTSVYNIGQSDYAIQFTGTSGTLVAPLASSSVGQSIKILNNCSGAITMTGPSFINGTGAMPYTLLSGHSSTQITSDGQNSWWLI